MGCCGSRGSASDGHKTASAAAPPHSKTAAKYASPAGGVKGPNTESVFPGGNASDFTSRLKERDRLEQERRRQEIERLKEQGGFISYDEGNVVPTSSIQQGNRPAVEIAFGAVQRFHDVPVAGCGPPPARREDHIVGGGGGHSVDAPLTGELLNEFSREEARSPSSFSDPGSDEDDGRSTADKPTIPQQVAVGAISPPSARSVGTRVPHIRPVPLPGSSDDDSVSIVDEADDGSVFQPKIHQNAQAPYPGRKENGEASAGGTKVATLNHFPVTKDGPNSKNVSDQSSPSMPTVPYRSNSTARIEEVKLTADGGYKNGDGEHNPIRAPSGAAESTGATAPSSPQDAVVNSTGDDVVASLSSTRIPGMPSADPEKQTGISHESHGPPIQMLLAGGSVVGTNTGLGAAVTTPPKDPTKDRHEPEQVEGHVTAEITQSVARLSVSSGDGNRSIPTTGTKVEGALLRPSSVTLPPLHYSSSLISEKANEEEEPGNVLAHIVAEGAGDPRVTSHESGQPLIIDFSEWDDRTHVRGSNLTDSEVAVRYPGLPPDTIVEHESPSEPVASQVITEWGVLDGLERSTAAEKMQLDPGRVYEYSESEEHEKPRKPAGDDGLLDSGSSSSTGVGGRLHKVLIPEANYTRIDDKQEGNVTASALESATENEISKGSGANSAPRPRRLPPPLPSPGRDEEFTSIIRSASRHSTSGIPHNDGNTVSEPIPHNTRRVSTLGEVDTLSTHPSSPSQRQIPAIISPTPIENGGPTE